MDDNHSDDLLDPEQDEAVRRLLADARHDDPIPDDLAARLDRVLAQLADEGPDEDPRVVDLATQRRRRRARGLLVAAAAVVAVGVGLGQLDLGSMPMSSQDAGSASSSGGDSEASVAQDEAAEAPQAANAPEDPLNSLGGGTTSFLVNDEPLVVGDDDFQRLAQDQAYAFVPTSGAAPSAPDPSSPSNELDSGAGTDRTADGVIENFSYAAEDTYRASWFSCQRAPFGRGRLVAVEYRDTSAVLAVRPPTGDSVVVELLQCGTATVLRSATVPLP